MRRDGESARRVRQTSRSSRGAARRARRRSTGSGPGRAMVVVGDALKQETLLDAARAALDEFGRIDGLINGAGGNILKPPPVKS